MAGVNTTISTTFNSKGIKQAETALQKFSKNVGPAIAGVAASFAAIGAGMAIKGFVDFTKQSISAASDLSESINAVNVAFEGAAEGVLKIGESAAESLGVSQTEFNNAAVRFSAFADRVVGEGGDVAEFIGDITTRATDFASVFNIDVNEALQVFQSGLSGEAEPLKRFGINMLQSEVQAFALANGIGEVGRELTETEKVQARYGLLLQETDKTAGDFANTSDGLANRQRILQASMTDLRAEFGEALLPAMESFAAIAQEDLMPVLSDLGESLGPVVAQVMQTVADVTRDNLVPAVEAFGDWLTSPEGVQAVQDFADSLGNLIISTVEITAAISNLVNSEGFQRFIEPFEWIRDNLTVVGWSGALIQELGGIDGALASTETQANNTANALSNVLTSGSITGSPTTMNRPENPKPGQKYTWFNYSGPEGQAVWYQQTWTGSEWTSPEKMTYSEPTTGGGGGGSTKKTAADFVNDFFAGLDDAVAKETARMELEDLGISDALIDDILGAQGWSHVYDEIVSGGEAMAESLQEQFNQTAEGAKELADELERIEELQTSVAEALKLAGQSASGIKDLFTTSKQLGDTSRGLEDYFDTLIDGLEGTLSAEEFSIIGDEMRAFLDENTRDLEQYARRRDQLIQDRDFARELIFGTAEAITAAGNITGLIDNTLTKVEEIDVSEVIEGVVDSADGLRGFKTTLTRNYTEVIEETASAADNLTKNFRGVVDRTRDFLDNLKILKELGLDPMLFNQLVEAGVEAGGATAQALVEGGSDTVNEVNNLQSELEELGVDIGEETYDTMKNAGEQFSSGIVDGIDANIEAIELAGENAAEAFAEAFEARLQQLLDEIMAEVTGMMPGDTGMTYPGHSEGRDSTGGVGYDTPAEFGDFGEIKKIANQTRGASLSDLATQYGVEYDKMREANPKFFDSSHKDYTPGYQDGEYLFTNTTVNIPQLAKGGIAMDQVLAMIGEQGPEAVIPLDKLDRMMNGNGATYNIYVNASGRSQGQQAGTEIVKALKTYQTTNGSINTALTGFGA